ncbi:MAG: hypothetical protein AAF725_24490 [Acidobacteriota bacterium]
MSFWLMLSLAIGYFGKDTKVGFVGFFLLAVLLSPIVGLIALYFVRKEDVHALLDKSKESAEAEAEPAAA